VFRDWSAYGEFVAWGRAGGSIPDPGYHWWDLRLHPGHGTLEIRACDAQTELADAVALVGFAQTLVAWLAGRYDRGERLAVHDSYRISESLWMGARSGAGGTLLDLQTGKRVRVAARIGGLLDELAPVAAELGTERELARASLLTRACGADRQRERVDRLGIDGLVDWLAERTLASARAYLVRAGVASTAEGKCP
jgi:carboxylate-amine ligase